MQLIPNGPDVPDELLQAHEEGRVVFFCGAGISFPAKLPGFKGLVEKIYELTKATKTPLEENAGGQWDTVLDLLERRLPGGAIQLRQALVDALKPNLRAKGALDTHKALLSLSTYKNHEQTSLRLVTSNFDLLFENAAKKLNLKLNTYSAPLLPVPKNSRWNGLVYLHGSLPIKHDHNALRNLIATSGDFGSAYLLERWAARFVSELLKNYIVCFVGYSINDPVMRYLMDALSAERALGEIRPPTWAFANYKSGEKDKAYEEWCAKGVTPILYEVLPNEDHSNLHKSLHRWADIYRNGLSGKKSLISTHVLTQPAKSTKQDDFVGRVLWALSDPSGEPAQYFSELNPTPSLDWLWNAFIENRYDYRHLKSFGIIPSSEIDQKLRFSFINRPTPYQIAHRMTIFSQTSRVNHLDKVMIFIARWLIRHLNNRDLIIWVSEQNENLNNDFVHDIHLALKKIEELEKNKPSQLEQMRHDAPDSTPNKLVRSLWRVLLSQDNRNADYISISERFKLLGLTSSVRHELRSLFTPRLRIRKKIEYSNLQVSNPNPSKLSELFDFRLETPTGHIISIFSRSQHWVKSLPSLVDDFQRLLLDSLELLEELGEANARWDGSEWNLVSISEHEQTYYSDGLASLIKVVRDAWLEIYRQERERARNIAISWWSLPFPTFKRLALFAAAQPDCVPTEQWVNWLLSDGSYWLWTPITNREVSRLLVQRGKDLTGSSQSTLEATLVAGPPDMNGKNIFSPEFQTWRYLTKLESSPLVLGQAAKERLTLLSTKHPDFSLPHDQRDEFSRWVEQFSEATSSLPTPNVPDRLKDLVQWLRENGHSPEIINQSTWRTNCQTRFCYSLSALAILVRENNWPVAAWLLALLTWSDKAQIQMSWSYAAPLVTYMPDDIFEQLIGILPWWLMYASEKIESQENHLISLSKRILLIRSKNTVSNETLLISDSDAFTHPVGQLSYALLNLWIARKQTANGNWIAHQLNDNEKLSDEFRQLFTEFADTSRQDYRAARFFLGAYSNTLYRVDPEWTETHLRPLFDWKNPHEAAILWIGLLWFFRIDHFTDHLMQYLPQTAENYTKLGSLKPRFARWLTTLALHPKYSNDKKRNPNIQDAFKKLPSEGLEEFISQIYQILKSIDPENRSSFWNQKINPLLTDNWMVLRENFNEKVSTNFIRMILLLREDFPKALDTIKYSLKPYLHLGFVCHDLSESELCSVFPEKTLFLLDKIIDRPSVYLGALGECLTQIETAQPSLKKDVRFERLTSCVRS